MRPLRLEFEAFGSYPGRHVVDFEALSQRGLFVVAGPTGAGKTTIFDAMVYALYGVLPGGRSGNGEPRSHHAAATVETFAQLDFEVDGQRYRVHRTPQQERPKKRSDGTTTQPAAGILSRLDGDRTEALATQTQRVTEECVRLVGLEAKHFQRVVLLPQGKFTEFLVANDESREQLLRQLFGGDLYERATRWLKQRADELEQQVAGVDHEVRHHRTNALDAFREVHEQWGLHLVPGGATPTLFDDPVPVPVVHDELDDQQLADAIAALQPVRDEQMALLDVLRKRSRQATELRTRAEVESRRFLDAQHHRALLAQLDATADDVAAAQATVDGSRRARPVVVAASRADEARADAAAAAEALDRLRDHVTNGFAALGRPAPSFDPAAVAAAVQQVTQQLEADRNQVVAARRARHLADEGAARATAATAALDTVAAQVQQAREQLATVTATAEQLQAAAGTATVRQLELRDASVRVATRRAYDAAVRKAAEADAAAAAAHAAYVDLMERFIAAAAPRLAESLHEGQPCPVCGATEHPAPATPARGAMVDVDQVDAARGDESRLAATAQSHRSVAEAHLQTLGDAADRSLDELLQAEQVAAEALKAAQRAEAQFAEATAAVKVAEHHLEQAVAAQAEHTRLEATARGEADALAAEADRLAELVVALDAEQLQAHTATATALATATANAAAVFAAVAGADAICLAADEAVTEALQASGYATVDAARAAVVPSADEAAAEQRVAEWHRQHAQSTTILEQLQREGIPDVAPDLERVRDQALQADAEVKRAAAQFTTASNALDRAAADLQQALQVAEAAAPLRRRCDTARRVYRTCNGEAGIRVKLERWVLAIELERVTASANDHLSRMTNHRYQLSRSAGQRGGLGLEVFDAHTGRSRATGSLSGGEQFQASLALALGLADVVSHGGVGSGKQFEALFVDEGFGSLDPAALDDAIVALQQLQAAGRTVGAITHVEAMKQQLHVGIEVSMLPDGHGSTLTVLP